MTTEEQSSFSNELENHTENGYENTPISQSKSAPAASNEADTKQSTEIQGSQDDIIDILLRSGFALIPAVFTSGTLAGLFEIAWESHISSGSISMWALTTLCFILWYAIFTKLGLFRD
jgi:hypothetical protein